MKVTTQRKTTTTNHHDELIKAETIAHCLVSQVSTIHDFMQAQAVKNPACVVYADILLDVMDKLADIETICMSSIK